MDRLTAESSLLLIVDVQERLAAAMPEDSMARLVKNATILLEAAAQTHVPVVASEQYPKGLGPTVEPLAKRLRALSAAPIDKLVFDAASEPRLARAIESTGARSVVVAG